MIHLDDLRLAATLLREPSLSAAARALDVTPPALSTRLRKLEAALGLTLARRDARRLSLTPEGERFGREAQALLTRIDGLCESMNREDQQLGGTLRIAAPFGYGRQHVAPLLARFSLKHPHLRIQLELRETPWPDRRDCDAVIHIGNVRDSSWVGRVLASNERWLCASPAYLAKHGEPKTPQDLANHVCIAIRENDEDVTLWHAHDARQTGKRQGQSLRITNAFVTNDGGVARLWAEAGLGIVLRSEWDAAQAIANGTLVRILADWAFDSAPVLLLLPTRKGRTARALALTEFLVHELGLARR